MGQILACNRVDRSQVQKLMEMASSGEHDPFYTLQAFALYQAARNAWERNAARLLVEALQWLRSRGASIDDLREALGYVKWVHRAVDRARRICPRNWNVDFNRFVNSVDPDRLFASIASNLR